MSTLAERASRAWLESARKLAEKCDMCCDRDAVLTVLDAKGYGNAVTCLECVSRYQVSFQDADGNFYNP